MTFAELVPKLGAFLSRVYIACGYFLIWNNALTIATPRECAICAPFVNHSAAAPMSFGYFEWIVLGLVAWALGVLVVLILMRMAGDGDRAARDAEKNFIPYSDVTITATG
jgi:hypothetical protein